MAKAQFSVIPFQRVRRLMLMPKLERGIMSILCAPICVVLCSVRTVEASLPLVPFTADGNNLQETSTHLFQLRKSCQAY